MNIRLTLALSCAVTLTFGLDPASAQTFPLPPQRTGPTQATPLPRPIGEPMAMPSGPMESRPLQIGEDASETADPGREFRQPPAIPGNVANQGTFSLPNPLPCEATYVGPLELEALLQQACEHNPTLRQAQFQISAQLATALEAGLYPNPTVTVLAEQLGIQENFSEFAAAEVQQKIVTGGKLALSRDKYLQRAKVADHLAIAQRFRVCTDVRIHFYRALAASERVRLNDELVKTAEDGLKTTREEYNLGQATAVDLRRANILLQRTRLMQLAARNDLSQHLAELSALAGVAFANPELVGSLEIEPILPSFDAEYARILNQSPELLAAHAKLREDYITLRREEVEPIPDLFVTAGPGYNFDVRETIANAAVTVEVPLFDRNQGNIQKMQFNIGRQKAEIRRTELDLRRRLAAEFNQLIQSLSEITEYEGLIVPQAREAYRLQLEAYRDDRQEWPEVLAAQQLFTERRLELVQHHVDAQISRAMIGGFLLHGGLRVPISPVPAGHLDATPDPR